MISDVIQYSVACDKREEVMSDVIHDCVACDEREQVIGEVTHKYEGVINATKDNIRDEEVSDYVTRLKHLKIDKVMHDSDARYEENGQVPQLQKLRKTVGCVTYQVWCGIYTICMAYYS